MGQSRFCEGNSHLPDSGAARGDHTLDVELFESAVVVCFDLILMYGLVENEDVNRHWKRERQYESA